MLRRYGTVRPCLRDTGTVSYRLCRNGWTYRMERYAVVHRRTQAGAYVTEYFWLRNDGKSGALRADRQGHCASARGSVRCSSSSSSSGIQRIRETFRSLCGAWYRGRYSWMLVVHRIPVSRVTTVPQRSMRHDAVRFWHGTQYNCTVHIPLRHTLYGTEQNIIPEVRYDERHGRA